MSFAVEAQSGEQRMIITLPKTGTSKHGKTVNLENPRLANDDPANDANNTITAHEGGDPFMFQVNSSVDASGGPVGFQVTATLDGAPGSGVSDLTDVGLCTWISPTASALGVVVATAEDLPTP